MTILSVLRTIAFTAGLVVVVEGVPVERSSLTGFKVAGQIGLSVDEAAVMVERLAQMAAEMAPIDASWPVDEVAPVAAPVAVLEPVVAPVAPAALAPVKAAPVKVGLPFYGKVQDAVKVHANLGSLRLRRSWAKGSLVVIVSCFAGKDATPVDHADLALILAGCLCTDGYEAKAVGSDVMVFAAT